MAQGSANLFISADTGKKEGRVPKGGNGVINLIVGNAGNDTLVQNSFEAVVSVGPNMKIVGFDRTAKHAEGMPNEWKNFSIEYRGRGLGNTVVIRNKRGYNAFDLSFVALKVQASKKPGKFMMITTNISYIHAKNPLLNDKFNIIQGDISSTDNNSTSSFQVV